MLRQIAEPDREHIHHRLMALGWSTPRTVLLSMASPSRFRSWRCLPRVSTDMRRVLLVQPSLQPPGGGNGVAAWMLQALVQEYHVTALSWRPVDLEPINRFFGTSLRSGDFDTLVVPRRWSAVPDYLPVPAALIRSALLMRYSRRVSDGFDVIVGVHNETDYGRRGIQSVTTQPICGRGRRSICAGIIAGRRSSQAIRVRGSTGGFLGRAHEGESHPGQFALDRCTHPQLSRHRRGHSISARARRETSAAVAANGIAGSWRWAASHRRRNMSV